MAIQLIEAIFYAPIHSIISFESYPGNKVNVNVVEWKNIPMTPASAFLEYSSRQDSPGSSYDIAITARLKENIGLIPESILKVRLCAGKELIIGTPFIPVKSDETNNLSLTEFKINHSSISIPSELILS